MSLDVISAIGFLPKVGARLGRFRLDAVLGQGGAGVVYKAFDETLETAVCLKLIHPAVAAHPEMIARFKRELLLARRITHPGICRLFDLHDEQDLRFLSMELVEGIVLREMFRGGNALDLGTTLVIGERLARALAAAHAVGVVHRDLKPQNIIVREGNDPCILDFGIATALDVTNVTRPGVPLGTRHYIPPEVWLGEKATPASDIYAVGVILFNCLTSRMPFATKETDKLVNNILHGERPRARSQRADAPDALDDLIGRCMAVRPGDRPATADAIADEITRLRTQLGDAGEARVATLPSAAPLGTGESTSSSLDVLTQSGETTPNYFTPISVDDLAPADERPAETRATSDSFTQERSWVVGGQAMDSLIVPSSDAAPALDVPTINVSFVDMDGTTSVIVSSPPRAPRAIVVVVILLALAGGALAAWSLRDGPRAAADASEPKTIAGSEPVATPEATAAELRETSPGSAAPGDAPGEDGAGRIAEAESVDDADQGAAPTDAAPVDEVTARDAPRALREVITRAPAPKPPRPRQPPRDDAERGALKHAKASLAKAQRSRGILRGDLPALDLLLADLAALERSGDVAGATRKVDEARDMVQAIRINDAFVRAKLARFNAAFDKTRDSEGKRAAGGLMSQVLQDLGAARHDAANRTLNQAFRRLREKD